MNIPWLLEQGPCKTFVAGELVSYPAGRSVDNSAMYILLSGAIDVYEKNEAGESKKVSSVVPGDLFCGREYFLGVNDYTYRASEDVTVYLLTKESFNDLSWSQPDILFEILSSAYTPPREPTPTLPPIAVIDTTAGKNTAVSVSAQAAEGFIYPPGHKIYKGRNFPMNNQLVYAKEYTCPLCHRPFQDFRVFSSKIVEAKPMRYDLRKFHTDFNTEWYEVLTCQHCFFSMFTSYFTDPKAIRKAAIEEKLIAACRDIPVDFSAPRDINHVFTMYYLAVMCCEGYPTLGNQLAGRLWSALSWLYEDVEDIDMMKYAAEKAAGSYTSAYTQGSLTPAQAQMACLCIAAMQHRAGIDDNLKDYLYKARTNKMGDKLYAGLADELWNELGYTDDEPEE